MIFKGPEFLGEELQKDIYRNCLAVQWLGLHISTSGGTNSILDPGTKILTATPCGKKKKKAHLQK